MNTPQPGYRIIDADNHYYEPDDCFTRHIENRWKTDTVRVDRSSPDGIGRMYIGQERLGFFSAAVGDFVGPPGAMRAFLRGESDTGAVNLNALDARNVPAFVQRNARLKLMDEQNVEAAIMLPTLGVGVEYQLRNHPEILYPSLRAFNRWVEEEWGYGNDGRIFSPVVLSLADIDACLQELDRVLSSGARLVLITPGPIGGRSPADPHFDRFWARLQEAGVPLIYHVGASRFAEIYAVPWGENPNPASHRHSALNMYMAMGERPVTDSLAALIFHNLFARFPGLKILSIENGSQWVKHLLYKLDTIARLNNNKDLWRFGSLTATPSELFKKHVWVAPYHEDDIEGLAQLIGPDRILAGSDFPHPEGLEWPQQFADELSGLDPHAIRKIMRSNSAGLLGLGG